MIACVCPDFCCRGGRYQGHKKTEKFLPVGAIVTVVGELARNSISTGAGMNLFRWGDAIFARGDGCAWRGGGGSWRAATSAQAQA